MNRANILFLAASPLVDYQDRPVSPLNLEDEIRQVCRWMENVDRSAVLTVEWGVPATLLGLLTRRRFDILHFFGHGSPDGQLAWEDGYGALFPLTADDLKGLLAACGGAGIRLVFLAACHSAALAQSLTEPESPTSSQ